MSNISNSDLCFCQLGPENALTEEQLLEAGRQIYATDDFIYPAMFCTKQDALRMIPEMFRMRDEMFRPENLFAAFLGERLAALILWKKGPMYWDSGIYERAAEVLHITPSRHLKKVQSEYFAAYEETAEDTIAVINVCVSEQLRGTGIGRRLLDAFLRSTEGSCSQYELFVLADNLPAYRLYTGAGFETEEALQGFSVEPQDLLCYRMLRRCAPSGFST